MIAIKSKKDLVKKTKHLWVCTYLQETPGWPGRWTVIWRTEHETAVFENKTARKMNCTFFGKISARIDSTEKPSEKLIENLLTDELTRRFDSNLKCDAKRVAEIFFTFPYYTEISGCRDEIDKLLRDYDDELIEGLPHGIDYPKVNELFQRLKDIRSARDSIKEIRKFIYDEE